MPIFIQYNLNKGLTRRAFGRVIKMKGRTIIHGKQYSGCFVATASFDDNKVVAHGDDPNKVRSKAEEKGHPKAVVVYLPKKGTVNLY